MKRCTKIMKLSCRKYIECVLRGALLVRLVWHTNSYVQCYIHEKFYNFLRFRRILRIFTNLQETRILLQFECPTYLQYVQASSSRKSQVIRVSKWSDSFMLHKLWSVQITKTQFSLIHKTYKREMCIPKIIMLTKVVKLLWNTP